MDVILTKLSKHLFKSQAQTQTQTQTLCIIEQPNYECCRYLAIRDVYEKQPQVNEAS